ncbi:MAG: hypothetical protein AB8H03_08960 [Saprospiraceae bacterium]
MNTTKGYLYAATGKSFTDEAAASVRSLRRFNTQVHVTLITDKPCVYKEFDNILIVDFDRSDINWKKGLLYKAIALQHSPYEKTFFVDTDTYFIEDCEELFDLLEYNDILMAHSPADVSKVIIEGKEIEGYHPYNTGVIVYKKIPEVIQLFKDWLTAYQEKFEVYPSDQTPFMESLLKNKVRLYVLLPFYNFREHFMVSLPPGKVKIIHGRPRDVIDLEIKINENIGHRTWLPRREKIIFRKQKSLRRRLKNFLPKEILSFYRQLK